MKKIFIVFIIPILLGITVFFLVTFLLSQKDTGMGALQVTSIPQSSVYLNDKFIGQTPLCKCDGQNLLPSGEYTIRLAPNDSSFSNTPFEQKITINKAVLTVVDRTFGQSATSQGSIITLFPQTNGDSKSGTLSVTSFPSEVTVSLDGNNIGESPTTLSHIVESDHDLLLQKVGYKDKTIRIHTVNGYLLSVIAFLSIDPNAVNATASGAINMATSSAIVSQTQSGKKIIILTTPTGFLRVRQDPSLGAAEISQVKPGDQYPFIAEQNGWTEIKLTNGTEGWVSSQYVSKQ